MNQSSCAIIPIGKRRDGGMRYWCIAHRGDATAKYGVMAPVCRYANTRFGHASPTKVLHLDDFSGGVGIWGAVPPVYDTTKEPLDAGIHVHARREPNGEKDLDTTYKNVELVRGGESWRIEELDAINYMVCSILGIPTIEVSCTQCGNLHLDKDWFAVHPHSRHLCSWCGQHFRDSKRGVGNPVAALGKAFPGQPPVKSSREIRFTQRDFPGGIRIWGSNPALLWTSEKRELSGIHLHAYAEDGALVEDDTFGKVIVDGVSLDPSWIRLLMAQSALPHLAGRVLSIKCPYCSSLQGDIGVDAVTPDRQRVCSDCHKQFMPKGRLKKVISNPIVAALSDLSRFAPRPPATHELGLLIESP